MTTIPCAMRCRGASSALTPIELPVYCFAEGVSSVPKSCLMHRSKKTPRRCDYLHITSSASARIEGGNVSPSARRLKPRRQKPTTSFEHNGYSFDDVRLQSTHSICNGHTLKLTDSHLDPLDRSAAIGVGDTMGIARQVSQHLLWPTERFFGVDAPIGGGPRPQERGERQLLCSKFRSSRSYVR